MNALKMELFELIERLPADQVDGAIDDLKRRAGPPRANLASVSEPFSWIGKGKGPHNASDPEVIDAMLAKGFGRN